MTEATVVPKLVIAGADQAIEYYQKALGAELTARYTTSDGSVVYSELKIGNATINVKDEDEFDRSATTLGGSAVILTLNVDDPDTVAAAMQEAGGSVVFPVGDMPYGYRQGRMQDPFGYQWIVSRRTEELSADDVQQRLGVRHGRAARCDAQVWNGRGRVRDYGSAGRIPRGPEDVVGRRLIADPPNALSPAGRMRPCSMSSCTRLTFLSLQLLPGPLARA
jgi:PhnB protein